MSVPWQKKFFQFTGSTQAKTCTIGYIIHCFFLFATHSSHSQSRLSWLSNSFRLWYKRKTLIFSCFPFFSAKLKKLHLFALKKELFKLNVNERKESSCRRVERVVGGKWSCMNATFTQGKIYGRFIMLKKQCNPTKRLLLLLMELFSWWESKKVSALKNLLLFFVLQPFAPIALHRASADNRILFIVCISRFKVTHYAVQRNCNYQELLYAFSTTNFLKSETAFENFSPFFPC